jgi:F0F1-type ATP synthase membrane subunit c/vacuolar-type H+-ATPase subunit K
MMIAAFMYVWLAEKLNAGHSPRDIKAMYVGIAAITLLMVFSALFLRRRFVAQSAELLRVDANNSAAVMRWRTGQIVGFGVAEAVVLYGLVVRFAGASTVQSAPFYVGGILLFLAFFPQRP